MKKPFIAIYTETANPNSGPDAVSAVSAVSASTAALLVIFANRDAQALEDVAGTRENLESQGEGVVVREFDLLADIPDIWDLRKEAGEIKAREAEKAAGLNLVAQNGQSAIGQDAVIAIHQCLKLLAGCCDGARTLDGAGFNKLDTEFGRSLAQSPLLSQKQAEHGRKLVRKYHRQLPADLLKLALDPHDSPDAPDSHECVRTPAELINHKYCKLVRPGVYEPKSGQEVAGNGCEEPYGDTYQVGVRPGPKKLAQFIEVLKLAGTPALYAQEDKGGAAMVHVKLFSTAGSWTWYITEFSAVAPDGVKNLAFGLVDGHEAELGYIDLEELANVRAGAGIEIDMHFQPQTLQAVREAKAACRN